MKRTSTAVWNGSGKEGKGVLSTQSGFLKNLSYTYASRFENAVGTNPEELVAAAHAACFAMKTSFVLGAAGFTPDALDVSCTVNLEGGAIIESHLELKAKVPGISAEKFAECANEAKATCPISKSLTAKITLDAKLM
jgi:osmotically inducible protein OsmC